MIEPKTQREKDSYLKGYREAEQAYGACHLCYGKGYSTTGTGGKTSVKFCSCDRGKQLSELWPKSKSAKARARDGYCPHGRPLASGSKTRGHNCDQCV